MVRVKNIVRIKHNNTRNRIWFDCQSAWLKSPTYKVRIWLDKSKDKSKRVFYKEFFLHYELLK